MPDFTFNVIVNRRRYIGTCSYYNDPGNYEQPPSFEAEEIRITNNPEADKLFEHGINNKQSDQIYEAILKQINEQNIENNRWDSKNDI